jgi:Prolyl oligopeptidase family.
MSYVLIALLILLGLFLLLAIASYLLFGYACVRVKAVEEGDPGAVWRDYQAELDKGAEWIAENKTETLEITSCDDLLLKGWLVPAENAKGTLILMHGYRSRAAVDYAPQAKFLHGLGYNLIIVMQRSHDQSEGRYITFGSKECMDCKLWVHEAIRLFGKESDIFLCGISMGASTVMMASQLQLPENVKGIVADCGFTSPWDIMSHVAKTTMHLPTFPLVHTASILTKHIARFDPKNPSALEAMRVNKYPTLFIHGGDDTFVPTYMSEKNYAACASPKELLIIPKAHHAQAYLVEPETYQKAVTEFFGKYSS